MADQVLPKGLRLFNPHANAPAFVKGSIVITLNELVQFAKDNPALLTDYNGNKQLKLQILESKEGKLYSAVDSYKAGDKPATPKPQVSYTGVIPDDDLPF